MIQTVFSFISSFHTNQLTKTWEQQIKKENEKQWVFDNKVTGHYHN